MKNEMKPDPAAILGAAMSLHNELEKAGNVSEAYNGADQFMRECMKAAELFETWACVHVDFDSLSDVWPYLLQDKLGAAYLKEFHFSELASVTRADCARIARHLPFDFWTGGVVVRPCVESAGQVSRPGPNQKPKFFAVYVMQQDNTEIHAEDFPTMARAQTYAKKLRTIGGCIDLTAKPAKPAKPEPFQIGERVRYLHPEKYPAMTHGRIVYHHGTHDPKEPRVRYVSGWGVSTPAAKLARLTPKECAELPEPALVAGDLQPRT